VVAWVGGPRHLSCFSSTAFADAFRRWSGLADSGGALPDRGQIPMKVSYLWRFGPAVPPRASSPEAPDLMLNACVSLCLCVYLPKNEIFWLSALPNKGVHDLVLMSSCNNLCDDVLVPCNSTVFQLL